MNSFNFIVSSTSTCGEKSVKKLNKELGDNENEQSSTNSINETRTSTPKETTSND
ncbi:hypothetical protein [Spiroplasma endosymbiont of Virgichneumon dumeticola]|uniref:hypothetical protein n=1 Tax=Spiroplasma endosymbiont of Virgichneumon dumeticola TaxID=3139323 RepID=UPI0035C8F023